MSKHWAANGSEQPSVESESTAESSSNGATAEDAVVADGSAEAQVATLDESAEEASAAAQLTDEASVSEAADDDAAVAAIAEDDPAVAAIADDDPAVAIAADEIAEPVAVDEGSLFVAELVRSMQVTASIERAKIGEDTERRRQAHIGVVRAREASEADRMRELAGDDMKAIEEWADGETKRIELERERRAKELNEDLETSLAEHRSKIDREIETAEAAISTYRAEVDAFFERLDRETDLIVIARQAAFRPVFPTLDAVGAASAGATEASLSASEEQPTGTDDGASGAGTSGAASTGVGVMDPAAEPDPVESWAAQPDAQPEPVSAGTSDDADQSGEALQPAEPVVAAAGSNHGTIGSLLVSVPVLHPMSWLRREANGGTPPNGEG